MRSWPRWLYLISALAAVLILAASAVQAFRQGSWAPVASVAWLPAVIAASWTGTGRCLTRRRARAGYTGPRR